MGERSCDEKLERGRSRVRLRLRTGMMAVAWLGLAFAVLRIPLVQLLFAVVFGMIAGGAAIVTAGVALGLVGYGLFALGDRVAAWARRLGIWPESADDPRNER